MAKGVVWMEEWMYCINDESRPVQSVGVEPKTETKQSVDEQKYLELKAKNERLMEEYKKMKKKADEYVGYYDHMKFFYEKFLVWKKFVDGKVFGTTEYNKKENWTQETMEMNRPLVYERYNFVYEEMEKAECDEVQHIINEIEGEKQKNIDDLPF